MTGTLCVASWSVRHKLAEPDFGWNGFASFLKEQSINAVELNASFMEPPVLRSPSLVYRLMTKFLIKQTPMAHVLETMKNQGVTPVLITIDGTDLFQKTDLGQKKQLEFINSWLEPAYEAGINRARVDMGLKFFVRGKRAERAMLDRLLATIKSLVPHFQQRGMELLLENHRGLTASPRFITHFVDALKEVDYPDIGLLLDCGNFEPKESIYDMIPVVAGSVRYVHVKTYSFDDASMETRLDYKRILENLHATGYDGYYSIEFEGKGDDLIGVRKTIDLVKAHTTIN